jgi:hypothetical protein
LAAVATATPVRHALIIGADAGYRSEDLRYAASDATALADVLIELGDLSPERVTVLHDPHAETLRSAVDHHRHLSLSLDDDLFLLYLAAPIGPRGLGSGTTRYPIDELLSDLERYASTTRIGFVDLCCGAVPPRLTQRMADTRKMSWLTAYAKTPEDRESDTLRSGRFAYALQAGLRGAADTNDSAVDLTELAAFVRSHTPDTGAVSFVRIEDPPAVVTDVRNASALLTLPAGLEGTLTVSRLPEKVPLVDVSVTSQVIHLGMQPGPYVVRQEKPSGPVETQITLEAGTRTTLDLTQALPALPTPRLVTQHTQEQTTPTGAGTQAPFTAGGASVALPGAGQLYKAQYAKGFAYFVATSALLVTSLYDPVDEIHGGATALAGAALWGASIADAASTRPGAPRRIEGLHVSFSGAFGVQQWRWPTHYGLSADLVVFHRTTQTGHLGISLGLDRVGYTPYPDGWDAHFGSRVMVGWEGHRWRPAALLAMGIRTGNIPIGSATLTRSVFGVGGELRYFVTPRYFTILDTRWERDGDQNGLRSGVGLGVQLGR